MATELEACFGAVGKTEEWINDAYRIMVRSHLEELLLGKLTKETWPLHMRFEGPQSKDIYLM